MLPTVKLPTDRYLLQCIYDMYKADYPGPKDAAGRGLNDPYVPIDVRAVAAKVGMSPELVFGRLYFHLDQKYRYKQDNEVNVSLFSLKVGEKRHAVQFPYLASILASQNQEFRRFALGLGISCFALGVSVVSLLVSILKR
jgi:hypothetical protein